MSSIDSDLFGCLRWPPSRRCWEAAEQTPLDEHFTFIGGLLHVTAIERLGQDLVEEVSSRTAVASVVALRERGLRLSVGGGGQPHWDPDRIRELRKQEAVRTSWNCGETALHGRCAAPGALGGVAVRGALRTAAAVGHRERRQHEQHDEGEKSHLERRG